MVLARFGPNRATTTKIGPGTGVSRLPRAHAVFTRRLAAAVAAIAATFASRPSRATTAKSATTAREHRRVKAATCPRGVHGCGGDRGRICVTVMFSTMVAIL